MLNTKSGAKVCTLQLSNGLSSTSYSVKQVCSWNYTDMKMQMETPFCCSSFLHTLIAVLIRWKCWRVTIVEHIQLLERGRIYRGRISKDPDIGGVGSYTICYSYLFPSEVVVNKLDWEGPLGQPQNRLSPSLEHFFKLKRRISDFVINASPQLITTIIWSSRQEQC